MKADALLLEECCFNCFFCRMNGKILGAKKKTPHFAYLFVQLKKINLERNCNWFQDILSYTCTGKENVTVNSLLDFKSLSDLSKSSFCETLGCFCSILCCQKLGNDITFSFFHLQKSLMNYMKTPIKLLNMNLLFSRN